MKVVTNYAGIITLTGDKLLRHKRASVNMQIAFSDLYTRLNLQISLNKERDLVVGFR